MLVLGVRYVPVKHLICIQCSVIAMHVYCVEVHLHVRIHGGVVFAWGLLFCVTTMVNMRWCICIHDLRRFVSLSC